MAMNGYEFDLVDFEGPLGNTVQFKIPDYTLLKPRSRTVLARGIGCDATGKPTPVDPWDVAIRGRRYWRQVPGCGKVSLVDIEAWLKRFSFKMGK